MTIARAQMYRQLYQLGGIGTLPMDFGQPLQIPQQPQPMFTTTGSATSSPLLNYGQTSIGQAGGTSLSRPGYQEGGLSDFYKAEEPIIPRIENIGGLLDQAEKSIGQPQNNFTSPLATTFSRFGMQEGGMGMDQMMQPQMQDQAMMQPQMMEPPLQGMESPQVDIKDPKQALELIIQMLIAQGIPPEQAKEIAIQMVQAVAEGGMGEMSEERIEARFGGRISNGREQFGLGSFFKSAGKAISGAVKGVTNAVKSVVKSDLGKAALAAAAIYATGGGSFFGYTPFPGATPGFSLANLPGGSFLVGTSAGDAASLGTRGIIGQGGLFDLGAGTLFSGASSLLPSTDTLKTFGLGALAGKFLGGGEPKREDFPDDASYQEAVNRYRAQFETALNNPNPQFAAGLYPNNPFYPQRQAKLMAANGGRIGYQEGGIGDLIKQTTQQEFFGTPMMAMGGRIGYAMGAEVPVRENQAGIKELDYRDTGGFVPPIGIKERADDIPAMLSNNEFVFTADAVRNAGGGDENLGAQRMYTLMKQLESGGSV